MLRSQLENADFPVFRQLHTGYIRARLSVFFKFMFFGLLEFRKI
ncbi:hypothetical protein [Bathymodiolus platifrons methanotrophic gill symbiont]|nr:hypothetical protein [Bathymodiolus platifrons methanotrophic gill symbiont]